MLQIVEEAGELAKTPIKLSDHVFIEKARQKLSYAARSIKVSRNSPVRDAIPYPWVIDSSLEESTDAMDALAQEIKLFEEYMKPSGAEKAAREAVIADTRALIAELMGTEVQSEVFGSEKTGLATAISDIDIRLSYVKVYGDGDPANLGRRMRTFWKKIQDHDDFICVVMRHAKFPIISAQHKRTGIDIQIVSSPDTKAQQTQTLQYLEEIPSLRPLYILLRTAFGIRGLVDVFYGGTGSYGLFIMIVAALQRLQSSNSPASDTSLSHQLFDILLFWRDFNTRDNALTLTPKPKIFKKHDPWEAPFTQQRPVSNFIEAAYRRNDPIRAAQWCIGQRRLYQPYLLCLQDPADPLNDLGRKANAIKHVQKTMESMAQFLGQDLGHYTSARAKGTVKPGTSRLISLVGRCHESYFERRKKMESFGLEVLKARERGLADGSNASGDGQFASETSLREQESVSASA